MNTDALLLTNASISGSLALLLFVVAINVSTCATVSCATDNGELSDRISSIALTLHAVGSISLWRINGVPSALITIDTLFLFALATVSTDISSVGHNYIALFFVTIRVSIISSGVGRLRAELDIISLYIILALRCCSLIFLFGYACPSVIPEVCNSLSSRTKLSNASALVVETGFVVCGMSYMLTMLYERPAWEADVLSLVSVGVAILGNAILAILRFSAGAVLLLGIGTTIDIALAFRIWKSRKGKWITYESVLVVILMMCPLVYFAS